MEKIASVTENFTIRKGALPGDFSLSIKKNGYRFGIIGLNSAFLQLTDANYWKRLDLDLHQLHDSCEGNIPKWIKKHHFAFLMTHHPPLWLSNLSFRNFRAEIAPPGQFLVHFYGHMHETRLSWQRVGGSNVQREWQGISLFGLKTLGNKKKKRKHGFSAGCIEILDENKGKLCIWPRVLKQLAFFLNASFRQ